MHVHCLSADLKLPQCFYIRIQENHKKVNMSSVTLLAFKRSFFSNLCLKNKIMLMNSLRNNKGKLVQLLMATAT